ncbi:lysylphosphatidylglycerol synthase domain-containing protein [Bordetella sp. 15P40C-2]|uniref:lysylphosphatidylglycerol synthase domain-containing protein n=1 Tax=Bordetella sp. 15P40C-2 TaxID=2572246 RepID=UPI001F19F134|nr:lysylphosphatidylglycerol synthase domain-containing protein [Bordetella sp. 15P40C-2]
MQALTMNNVGRRWSQLPKRTRRLVRRGLALCLLAVVVGLLYFLARDVDWPDVRRAVREMPKSLIALALGVAVAAYFAYASMDLLGKRYVKHDMPNRKVLGFAMLSYALNINLGTIIGGFGARLRFYLRLGYRKSVPTRVALFSAISNWLGFGWLAGAVFLSGLVPLPAGTPGGQAGLRVVGAILLAVSAFYVWACWRHPGRAWTIKRWRVVLPTVKMAAGQCIASAMSWGLMGLVFYVVLQGKIPYAAVLGVLLYCSVAALIVRVPGGLGTTEALTAAALSKFMPASEVIAAVLVYRAVYFLIPLVIALIAYGVLEMKWSAQKARSRRAVG